MIFVQEKGKSQEGLKGNNARPFSPWFRLRTSFMSKCCSEIVKAMATASSVAGVASGSRRRAPNMTHCPLQTGWPKASFMPGGAYLGGIGPFHCYPGSFPCHTHPGWLHCWVVKPNKCLHSSWCTWHCMTMPLPSAPLAHVAPVFGCRAFEGLPQ